MRLRFADERGSFSVLGVAVIVVLAVVAMGLADLGRVLLATGRAQTAADAAALAAAQSLAFPTELEPEAAAALLAERNGAELASCACEAGTFEARVEVRTPVGALFLAPDDLVVAGSARAVVEVP
jgi:secretion/DNA translocation related TadE-like protein